MNNQSIEILKLLDANDYTTLIDKYDELCQELKSKNIFPDFVEEKITFPPTLNGRTKKPKAFPSYDNRILYKSNSIACLEYNSCIEFILPSDPVYFIILHDFTHTSNLNHLKDNFDLVLFDNMVYIKLLKPYEDENIKILQGEIIRLVQKTNDLMEIIYQDKFYKIKGIPIMEMVALSNGSDVLFIDKIRYDLWTEFLLSEKNYVRLLKLVVEHFDIPLKKILDPDVHLKIFNSINTIYNLNLRFLTSLSDNTKKGDIEGTRKNLNEFIQALRLYAPYIQSYQTAFEIVSEEKLKNSKFSKFLQTKTEILEKYNLKDINDLLIVPIQRLPEYQNLFQTLAKYTPENDREAANKTISMINEIVDSSQQKAKEYQQDLAIFLIERNYEITLDKETKIIFEKKSNELFFLLEIDKITPVTELIIVNGYLLFQFQRKRFHKKFYKLKYKEIDQKYLQITPKTLSSRKLKVFHGLELSGEQFILNFVIEDKQTYERFKKTLESNL